MDFKYIKAKAGGALAATLMSLFLLNACSQSADADNNSLIAGLALGSGGDSELSNLETNGASQRSFEAWKETLYQEPLAYGGAYIIDQDLTVYGEKNLREYYNKYSGKDGGLIVNQVGGVDTLWTDTEKRVLTYCVSYTFGDNYQLAVDAMREATRGWARVANVRYLHLFREDSNCDAQNTNVVFDVNPGPANAPYIARAFFPDNTRVQRNVLIRDFVVAAPQTLVGVLEHELGHTLGFRHEHIRLFGTPEQCSAESLTNARPVTVYDRVSVMHYPQCGDNHAMRISALDAEGTAGLYGASVVSGSGPYSLGGVARGVGVGLTLHLNGQDLALTGDGEFSFPAFLAEGDAYALTVTAPAGQECFLNGTAGLSGVMGAAGLDDIVLECMDQGVYPVVGTAFELGQGQVELRLNGGETIAVQGNGLFQFSEKLANGSNYKVEIISASKNAVCYLDGAQGKIFGAASSGMRLECYPPERSWRLDKGFYGLITPSSIGESSPLAFSHKGKAYVVFSEYYKLRVAVKDKQGWTPVGEDGPAIAGIAYDPTAAIQGNRVCLGWREASLPNFTFSPKVACYKPGTGWTELDVSKFLGAGEAITYGVQLASHKGKFYAVSPYSTAATFSHGLRVLRLDGNTWTVLSDNLTAGGLGLNLRDPRLVSNGADLYVAWHELSLLTYQGAIRAKVMVSSGWDSLLNETDGSDLSAVSGSPSGYMTLAGHEGRLWMAWGEVEGVNIALKIRKCESNICELYTHGADKLPGLNGSLSGLLQIASSPRGLVLAFPAIYGDRGSQNAVVRVFQLKGNRVNALDGGSRSGLNLAPRTEAGQAAIVFEPVSGGICPAGRIHLFWNEMGGLGLPKLHLKSKRQGVFH